MVADAATASLVPTDITPSKPFHHIAIHWSSNGANSHASHYVAPSRKEALFVAAYYAGWYQSRAYEVREVVIRIVPTGTTIPLPAFLSNLLDAPRRKPRKPRKPRRPRTPRTTAPDR